MIEWYYVVALVVYLCVLSAGFVIHLVFDGWGGAKTGPLAGLALSVMWPVLGIVALFYWLYNLIRSNR